MTVLHLAKEKLNIPDLARLRGWNWVPGQTCRLPYQPDHKASGSVLADGKLFHDFTSGETMDAPGLLGRVEELSNADACKLFIQVAGVNMPGTAVKARSVTFSKRVAVKPPERQRPKPRLPCLYLPTREELERIARLRNVSLDAVILASKRGWLFVSHLHGVPCWAVTDSSRWLCQLRRMDGKLFTRREGLGFKAWTLAGSRAAWPLGCEAAKSFPSVALVEGGGDFLAACHFIALEGRGGEVTPVAMLGAANRIAADALPFFRGKRVRIFAHIDKPNEKGQRPGYEAAARWEAQLEEVGAVVTTFDLSGLHKANGEAVEDLNDLTQLSIETLQTEPELSPVMSF